MLLEQFVPVVAVVLGFALLIIFVVMFFVAISKLIKARHQEKIAMIERGLTEMPSGKRGKALLVSGLVFAAIGLALIVGLPIAEAGHAIVGGLVPLFIGLALVGGHYLGRKEGSKKE